MRELEDDELTDEEADALAAADPELEETRAIAAQMSRRLDAEEAHARAVAKLSDTGRQIVADFAALSQEEQRVVLLEILDAQTVEDDDEDMLAASRASAQRMFEAMDAEEAADAVR